MGRGKRDAAEEESELGDVPEGKERVVERLDCSHPDLTSLVAPVIMPENQQARLVMAHYPTDRNRCGFTMGQLLVVIFVVSILVGLIIPWIQRQRREETAYYSINRVKQLCWSLHDCKDVNKRLPPATGTFGQQTTNMSLSVHLLPYIEQGPLYKLIVGGIPPKNAVIMPFLAHEDFTSSDPQRVQNFAANVRIFTETGIKTAWNTDVVPVGNHFDQFGIPAIPRTFADGTSNTIVFSTRFANNTARQPGGGNINCTAYDAHYIPGSKTSPFGAFFGGKTLTGRATAHSKGGFQLAPTITQANCAPGELAHSFNRIGILVGLGDASVRTVSASISTTTWNQAMCPNDGNELGSDWDF